MIDLYFFALVVLVILTRILSMAFTAGMKKVSPDMRDPGVMGVAYERYTNRALLGIRPVPTRGLRMLRFFLRLLAVPLFLGYCGALYIGFSDGSMPGQCELCQLDPHGKSIRFWAAYSLAISLTLASNLGSMMVLRSDPRVIEVTRRVDFRRLKRAVRMIFQDRPVPADRMARWLRDICRCLILFAMLDALLVVGTYCF